MKSMLAVLVAAFTKRLTILCLDGRNHYSNEQSQRWTR